MCVILWCRSIVCWTLRFLQIMRDPAIWECDGRTALGWKILVRIFDIYWKIFFEIWFLSLELVNKVKVSQKTNSSIELNWSANCTVKNILTFAVSYCPVPQENSSNCTAERKIQYFDCPQSVMKLKDLQTDRWHQINVTFQSTTQMFPQQKLSVKTSTTRKSPLPFSLCHQLTFVCFV